MADKGMKDIDLYEKIGQDILGGDITGDNCNKIVELIESLLSHQLEAIEREVEGLDGWTYGPSGLTKAKGRGLLERKEVLSIIDGKEKE